MNKSYLFLQGPHGPIFKALGKRLKKEGHKVLRVNLNGGDWIDWNGPGTIDFTNTEAKWQDFLSTLLHSDKITDLIVYGDCRGSHMTAIELARAAGIRIHVFEEGYIRSKWITLERDGVNGNSRLISNKEAFLKELKNSSVDASSGHEAEKFGPSMRWSIFYCLRYYLFKSIFSVKFRNYIRHRPYRPYQELLLWLGYLLHMPLHYFRTNIKRRRLFQNHAPFYLVCLQLDSDAQLRAHSKYLSMANFINDVLRSFHKHAPPESFLVFKKHPLDPGAIPYATLVRLEAYSLGIRERIMFLHTGSLPDLIKASEGVVLMNSTVGTSALHHGKPTVVMGNALYDIPGLTWQKGLNLFWTEAEPPDAQLFKRFRSHLLREVLINGGFYNPKGIKLALGGIIQRL